MDVFAFVSWTVVVFCAVTLAWPLNVPVMALAYKVRLGTQPLDVDGWGLDVVIGGSQKAFMIPPGLAFLSVSPKAWAFAESSKLPKYYFNLKKEKKNAASGE